MSLPITATGDKLRGEHDGHGSICDREGECVRGALSEVAVTQELLDAVPTPVVVIRVSDWKCLYANAAAAALFGVAVSELIGQDLAVFFGQASDPVRILERLVVDRQVADFESHIIDRAENRQRVMVSGGCAFSEGSQAGMLVIRPAYANHAPAIAAARDALTGLPNRNALMDRLQEAIRRAAPLNRIVAVLFIDLNCFKAINDQHGHLIGDQLLAIIASRLAGCVRHYETVARLGGDEFGIILDGLRSSQEAARVSQEVQRVASQPVSIGNLSLRVTASVGIAFYPIDAPSASQLLHAADQAMYQQKPRTAKPCETVEEARRNSNLDSGNLG
ncbi:GGDEF domain-containing protein [Aquisalimonas sp.]|uniref:GGDEF domain-containing protein n=1 Tax=Aquisalimonas sp. TaxID=1872621 RepID=UPI0025C60663|nr:GGDEF domain-containing protein [Aquisalimonas sp.]